MESTTRESITKTGTTPAHTEHGEPIQAKRLLWAGPLTALASAIGTVLVREVAVLVGAVPADVQILQEPAVALSTISFVLIGTLVFAAIIRFVSRPVRTFRAVGIGALVLSMFNPIAAGAGWMPVGVSLGIAAVASMMVMHVVAAVITIYLLPALARGR